ncbi:MAG: hypothetical protein KIT28_14435, partial [Rubrivivax sp.]|nr:hypothetical protein [Rubrivivax sp.]
MEDVAAARAAPPDRAAAPAEGGVPPAGHARPVGPPVCGLAPLEGERRRRHAGVGHHTSALIGIVRFFS